MFSVLDKFLLGDNGMDANQLKQKLESSGLTAEEITTVKRLIVQGKVYPNRWNLCSDVDLKLALQKIVAEQSSAVNNNSSREKASPMKSKGIFHIHTAAADQAHHPHPTECTVSKGGKGFISNALFLDGDDTEELHLPARTILQLGLKPIGKPFLVNGNNKGAYHQRFEVVQVAMKYEREGPAGGVVLEEESVAELVAHCLQSEYEEEKTKMTTRSEENKSSCTIIITTTASSSYSSAPEEDNESDCNRMVLYKLTPVATSAVSFFFP